jgi:hypothetical protein
LKEIPISFKGYGLKGKDTPIDWGKSKSGTASVWSGELEAFPYGATQAPVALTTAAWWLALAGSIPMTILPPSN